MRKIDRMDPRGYNHLRQGELAYIIVKDGEIVEHLFKPDEADIDEMITRYGMDRRETWDIIENREEDIYGIMFDLELYRIHLEELREAHNG